MANPIQSGDRIGIVRMTVSPEEGQDMFLVDRVHLPGSAEEIGSRLEEFQPADDNVGTVLHFGSLKDAVDSGVLSVGLLLDMLDEKLSVWVGETTVIKRTRPRLSCQDCDIEDVNAIGETGYMLHNELWTSIGMLRRGLLCVGCAEKRLGRELTPADFTSAPVNDETEGKSDRLLHRQGHRPSSQ